MARARPPVIVLLTVVAAIAQGCTYAPYSDRRWTPEQAKRVILDFQVDQVHARGATVVDDVLVTDDYMLDVYGPGSPSALGGHRLRRVYFRDVEAVYLRWEPASLAAPLLTVGLIGPYHHELCVRVKPRVGLPGMDAGSGREIVMDRFPQWWWTNWFGLWVVPWRPMIRTDEVGEAMLYMARRAQGGRLPGE
jgi:hypothetical protein